MAMGQQKEQAVINKFHELLRSGKDYSAAHMYREAGMMVYVTAFTARMMVNKYYRGVVSDEMTTFFNGLIGSNSENTLAFGEKFNLCKRESLLIIRYIKVKKKI